MKSIEDLLNAPYWIIDIFPMRVPENSPGRFFEVEAYYLKERLTEIKQKHVDLVLKLNCYIDLSLEGEHSPSPARIEEIMRDREVFILLGDAMLLAAPDDTHMTLFNPDERLLELIRAIAQGEGLFVWEGGNSAGPGMQTAEQTIL